MAGEFDDFEVERGEEVAVAIFKAYLRSLKSQLLELKQAITDKDFDKAEKLVNDLIADTTASIEG